MMREEEESSSTLSTPQQHHVEEGNVSITMRDLLHSSNLSAATMLLDENHCVVDASPAMLSLLQVRHHCHRTDAAHACALQSRHPCVLSRKFALV
jgi:hypothetical protein